MNYISIGILVIVGVIVAAAIFNANFQEKIFGGAEGEARIAGIISVKGVSFTVLLLGLLGLASYHEGECKEYENLDPNTIIERIQGSNDFDFSFDFSSKDSIGVLVNGVFVKKVRQPIKLSLEKSLYEKSLYNLTLDDEEFENIKLNLTKCPLIYEEGNSFFEDTAYRIENSNFWFKLEEINTLSGNVSQYMFRFGEGESSESVKWTSNSYPFGKSANGRPKSSLHILSFKEWEKSYAFTLGAGKCGSIDHRNHIEMINIFMAEINVEK